MSDSPIVLALNELLITAYRSLLQYTMECWPWSDVDDASVRQAVAEMAAEQRGVVAQMAEWLDRRQQPVDFGTFPDWSALHFVSLDFLLAKLIADESSLIAAIERAEPLLKSDPTASAIAVELLHLERKHHSRLRELAASRNAATASVSS